MGFSIQEKEDCISLAKIREIFESSVKNTAVMSGNCDLSPSEKAGVFDGYSDDTTDIFFAGFGIGIRLAERAAKLQIPMYPFQKS